MTVLRFLPPAAKYLKKMKDQRLKELFRQALGEIAADPGAGTAKHGDLEGVYGYDIYYHRTNYELAYTVRYEEDRIIIIIMAGTRENFYEELKRYMK